MKLKSWKSSNGSIQFTSQSVTSAGITYLVVILTTLMGSHPAQAQGPDIPLYVPIISVGVVSFIVFFACVCIIVCCIAKHSRSTRSTFTHYLTGVHVDTRQQRGQGYLAGVGAQASYPPQSSTPYPTSPAGSTSHTVQ